MVGSVELPVMVGSVELHVICMACVSSGDTVELKRCSIRLCR